MQVRKWTKGPCEQGVSVSMLIEINNVCSIMKSIIHWHVFVLKRTSEEAQWRKTENWGKSITNSHTQKLDRWTGKFTVTDQKSLAGM